MEYEKVSQEEGLLGEHSQYQHPRPQREPLFRRALPYGYLILFTLSICLNGLLLSDRSRASNPVASSQSFPRPGLSDLPAGRKLSNESDISPNTGLARNIIKPYTEHLSDYHNPENWTLSHEAWKEIEVNNAIVAIDNVWAKQQNLAPSQPFPWDKEGHSIYTLHGMHQLHCIKQIYLSQKEYQNDEPQSFPWEHLSHCFDSIRREIMCNADDTLRESYQGKEGTSGVVMSRQCRNWDAYAQWAEDHSACFYRPLVPDWSTPSIEYYKHCPKGSSFTVDFDVQA